MDMQFDSDGMRAFDKKLHEVRIETGQVAIARVSTVTAAPARAATWANAQVPPNGSSSTMATDWPALRRRSATLDAAVPAPITTKSYWFGVSWPLPDRLCVSVSRSDRGSAQASRSAAPIRTCPIRGY